MRRQKYHGRFEGAERPCDYPGCLEPGEFRAPGSQRPSFDGPGDYRWFCLDHVRAFNSGYDWFEGMSMDEILAAQSPAAGWRNETMAFRGDPSAYSTPRWADFEDPLSAIGARADGLRRRAAGTEHATPGGPRRFTAREQEALTVMGLGTGIERTELRRRYSELVRRYHPDRNGGDRSHESRLQRVVEAYQVLRRADAFS